MLYKLKHSTYILYVLFLIFCFFPYLRILPFNLDSQPNALILSLVIFILNFRGKIAKNLGTILLMLVSALPLMVISNFSLLGLKAFLPYLSLFFISYATYQVLKCFGGIPYKLFKYVVFIWFVVGLIQSTIYPSFCDFFLYRSDNLTMLATGRGVTSLAVEPTFYGMICIFLLMINYLNFSECEQKRLIDCLLLIQILFFSKSTTCFIIAILAVLTYGFFKLFVGKHKVRWISIFLLCGCVILIAFSFLLQHSEIRFAEALRYMINNPSTFVLMDVSVNIRFVHAVFPILGFFENGFMPHGLGVFNEYLTELINDEYWGNFIIKDIPTVNIIVSSLCASLYELGIFALPFLFTLIRSFLKLKHKKYALFCLITLLVMMLNHMNYNQAILPMFIGNIMYLSNLKGTSPSINISSTSKYLI